MLKMQELSLMFNKMQISNGNKHSDLFSNLPPEIIIEILSRLPFRSIIKSKLVHKAWRDLIESREFGRFHHLCKPDPHPYLIVFSHLEPEYKILELDNGSSNSPNKFLTFTLPYKEPVHSSVNGLTLLCRFKYFQHLLVCNPITREYVRLPAPPAHNYSIKYSGFGVSRTSKQYKVVLIYQSECQVYTLGTGHWRSIRVSPPQGLYGCHKWDTECAFVAGNLHWLDHGTLAEEVPCSVSCFDLETEVLTSFPAPPPPPRAHGDDNNTSYRSLSVLEDCLCLCDVLPNSKGGDKIEVWLRRGERWRKEFVIRDGKRYLSYNVFPIKVLEDGGMLLSERGSTDILHCSSKTKKKKTTKKAKNGGGWCRRLYHKHHSFESCFYDTAAVYTPNFIPLKTLLMETEDVRSF